VLADVFGKHVRFNEKQGSADTLHINAGFYILSRGMVRDIPSGACISLERELFPRWLAARRNIRVFVHPGKCIDIGTPERYQVAQDLLAAVEPGVSDAAQVKER
jgi:NDP-sugar pyrophosphorylase family protein